jgi:hypothetical protein
MIIAKRASLYERGVGPALPALCDLANMRPGSRQVIRLGAEGVSEHAPTAGDCGSKAGSRSVRKSLSLRVKVLSHSKVSIVRKSCPVSPNLRTELNDTVDACKPSARRWRANASYDFLAGVYAPCVASASTVRSEVVMTKKFNGIDRVALCRFLVPCTLAARILRHRLAKAYHMRDHVKKLLRARCFPSTKWERPDR